MFGTDGLWNVVSPQAAVDNVRHSDQMNEQSACNSESREWLNPSKNLVDKALERWSTKKMRADNTSVVIIMFDPPGPAKRDILKSSPSHSQMLGYLASEEDSQPSQHLEIEPVQNFAVYDHSTNELMDSDGLPLPTSGATVLTRYENITESDVQKHNQQQAYTNDAAETNMNGNEGHYMSSFAESYNSLLNSSLNEDHSYLYNNEASEDSDFDDSNSYDNPNTTHQYMERSHDATYSLHKLQTRSEQQYNEAYASTSSSPMPSTSHSMYVSYPHNLVDHNYLGESNEYAKIDGSDETKTKLLPLKSSEYLMQPNASVDPSDMKIIENPFPKESKSVAIKKKHMTKQINASISKDAADELNEVDDYIQINEISSSGNNRSMFSLRETSPRLRKPSTNLKKAIAVVHKSSRKVTRQSLASSLRVTRSTGTEKRAQSTIIHKKVVALQKPTTSSQTNNGRVHKENISILQKVPVKGLVDSAIVMPSRTRNTEASQSDNKPLKQRTLRSQNALTKDTTATRKTVQRAHVNNIMQQIGRVVPQAKMYPARANNNTKSNSNSKIVPCKKTPKRLINPHSVQMVKSNNSNKLRKSESMARTSLRFKVVMTRKSVVEQLNNTAVRPSVITRRTRLQQ